MRLAPDEAKQRILDGTAPAGLHVAGALDLRGAEVTELPPGLRCHALEAAGSQLERLPADLDVPFRIDLGGCTRLRGLPDGLRTGTLVLRDCAFLETLPRGLRVHYLDLTRCAALAALPDDLSIRFGRLDLTECGLLRRLPPVGPLSHLALVGCRELRALPEGLRITSWLDVAFTGLTSLPDALAAVPLRWRGVPVSRRIALDPGSLSVEEVLSEPNTELRRVMIEAMGYERFLAAADPTVLDRDADPGGARALYLVDLHDHGEPLVCVAFSCPSTGRRYVIRVPPTMRTCHQAVAWMAGFDDPAQYRPLAET